MSEPARVIVVDDELELRQMVAEYLGRHGFDVRTAGDGAELDALLEAGQADLLILDVNMPGENGFTIARRLRALSDIPILMLTAAGELVDRVVGLEIGADDYLVKPFDLRELRARIGTILRRAAAPARVPAAASGIPRNPAALVRFGNLLLDLEARELLADDGTRMDLTAMEFDLLAAFARNPDRVLSRDQLLNLAHHRDAEPFDRSIDVRITRIRRKIEPDPARPSVIKTVHGAGYIFVATRTAAGGER
jgi:two-component system phosphate regulon response regulator OmpR